MEKTTTFLTLLFTVNDGNVQTFKQERQITTPLVKADIEQLLPTEFIRGAFEEIYAELQISDNLNQVVSEMYRLDARQKTEDIDEVLSIGDVSFNLKTQLKVYDNYPSRKFVKGSVTKKFMIDGVSQFGGITLKLSKRPRGIQLICWFSEEITEVLPFFPALKEGQKMDFIDFENLTVQAIYDVNFTDYGRVQNIEVQDTVGSRARLTLWNDDIERFTIGEGQLINLRSVSIAEQNPYPPKISFFSKSELEVL